MMHLIITVRQNPTVLPRILQILSRRQMTLTRLETRLFDGGTAELDCIITVPEAWQRGLPGLLRRLIDVLDVRVQGETTNG